MRVFRPQLTVMMLIPLDQALLVQLFSSCGHGSFTGKRGYSLAWSSNYDLPIDHGANTNTKVSTFKATGANAGRVSDNAKQSLMIRGAENVRR